MNRSLSLLFALIALTAFTQKKQLDHTVYDNWKSLKYGQISPDGKFISYQINPHKGDGYLYLYDVQKEKLDSMPRGTQASFSGNGAFLLFHIKPFADTLRRLELDKVDKKKWPKDSLGIYYLAQDSLVKYENLKDFECSEKSDRVLIKFDHNNLLQQGKKKKKKKSKGEGYKSEGTVVAVLTPGKELEYIKDVKSMSISDDGLYAAYTIHKKIKADSVYLVVRVNTSGKEDKFALASTDITKINFDSESKYLAYLSTADTAKNKNYGIYLIDLNTMHHVLIADTSSSFVPEELAPGAFFTPVFTNDGRRLFYGLGERQKTEEKDSLLDSEKATVDVWHYKDNRLQPQQLKELKRDQQHVNIYCYDLEKKESIALSDDTLEFSPNEKTTGDWVLAHSNNPYQSRYNWEYPWKSDYYLLNLSTGERRLIKEAEALNVSLSPEGEYFVYFDGENYQVLNTNSGKVSKVDSDSSIIWIEDMNGMPAQASNFWIDGWTGEDQCVVHSRHNLYTIDTKNAELNCITCLVNEPRNVEMRFHNYTSDSVYLDLTDGVIKGFDTNTKGTHVYKYKWHGDHADVVELAYFDAEVHQFDASRNRETFTYRKMTIHDYPEIDVYQSSVKDAKRISVTNPQQSEYIWPTVELVNWKTYKGEELQGLLYKPDNFDPSEKYPLLVYYYELYTDRYHQYYNPKPTPSIIFPTEYASAGYVVFIPDIRYETGHPAKSAYDAIMSGTDEVLKLYPNIDSTRMGLQGQSWGGYQTAQLVTMTNRYAAAMAGAPVSNMFSAYGGIRWGSGFNRQFQYEKSQSRIGATIWEKPELYIENSPLFGVPNIQTPLLIMHNDHDGAVPWYQGIEMFTAMKRLNKPVWMLNYNDDDHNLMKDANRRDLSVRMRQFFDFYLQGKPAPKWLIEGVPAIDKGVDYGLEYIENDKK